MERCRERVKRDAGRSKLRCMIECILEGRLG